MAILTQSVLFSWDQIDTQDDLHRLRYVLDGLPDEPLMCELERRRGQGRDDYPIRAMWNSVIAGIVFQHVSVESLRRELQRNAALRHLCGFDPFKGVAAVPPAWVYTRFLHSLIACQALVDAMFNELVAELMSLLPDLGEHLAGDGKAIASHANKRKPKDDDPSTSSVPTPDGRRDTDADVGVKTYRGKRKDGTLWEKVSTWFGYQLNLIVDTKHELPVGYTLTKASRSEVAEMKEVLLPKLEKDQPELLERCEVAMFDKGFDDAQLITQLDEDHGIAPIIDIRNCWKDGKTTKSVPGTHDGQGGPNIVQYDYQGNVTCWSQQDGQHYPMAYGGYEKDRQTHKYRCPAKHYGMRCASMNSCPIGSGSGQVRVPLSIDRRIFTPVARSSYKWKTLYDERSAIERVNSRFDQNFGFERHFIRGHKKMTLRVSLALIVMLAMARGRIMHDQAAHMRSLIRPAA